MAKWVWAAHTLTLPWAHLNPYQKGLVAKQRHQLGLEGEQQGQRGPPTLRGCLASDPHLPDLLPQNRVTVECGTINTVGSEERGRG